MPSTSPSPPVWPITPEQLRHLITCVTPRDLIDLSGHLPAGTAEMVRVLGREHAARLVNSLPGVLIRVPVAESTNESGRRRRAELGRLLGDELATTLFGAYGGETMRVPVLRTLLAHKRRRWISAAYDALTTGPSPTCSSQYDAINLLCMSLAAAGLTMTAHQIERALNEVAPDASDLHQLRLL